MKPEVPMCCPCEFIVGKMMLFFSKVQRLGRTLRLLYKYLVIVIIGNMGGAYEQLLMHPIVFKPICYFLGYKNEQAT